MGCSSSCNHNPDDYRTRIQVKPRPVFHGAGSSAILNSSGSEAALRGSVASTGFGTAHMSPVNVAIARRGRGESFVGSNNGAGRGPTAPGQGASYQGHTADEGLTAEERINKERTRVVCASFLYGIDGSVPPVMHHDYVLGHRVLGRHGLERLNKWALEARASQPAVEGDAGAVNAAGWRATGPAPEDVDEGLAGGDDPVFSIAAGQSPETVPRSGDSTPLDRSQSWVRVPLSLSALAQLQKELGGLAPKTDDLPKPPEGATPPPGATPAPVFKHAARAELRQ